MPLSDHLELMQRLCAKAGQDHECPIETHFRAGLMSLKEFSTDYDAIVDEHNPFYQEFTKYLNQDALETDDLFSLFECLVIFIRMRQMACSGIELSVREQNVLDYFESCGEWASRDNTLVSNWYWKQLPAKQRSH